jgi:hypothetical protein
MPNPMTRVKNDWRHLANAMPVALFTSHRKKLKQEMFLLHFNGQQRVAYEHDIRNFIARESNLFGDHSPAATWAQPLSLTRHQKTQSLFEEEPQRVQSVASMKSAPRSES